LVSIWLSLRSGSVSSESLLRAQPHADQGIDYASVTVFFWCWGEHHTPNNSIALTEPSRLWGYYNDSMSDQSGDLKRVIIRRADASSSALDWSQA
jgi:hypothetical protein